MKIQKAGKSRKIIILALIILGGLALAALAFSTYYFRNRFLEVQKEIARIKEENQLFIEKDLARQKEYEQEIEKQIGTQETLESKLISKLSKQELKAFKLENRTNALASKNKRLIGRVERLKKEKEGLLDLIRRQPLEKAKIINQLENMRMQRRNWLVKRDQLLADIKELKSIISQNDKEKTDLAQEIVNLEVEKDRIIQEMEIQPNDYQAFYLLGIKYFETRNYKRALWYFSKTISVNPDYTQAYKNRGYIYMIVHKNKEKACRDWQKACALGTCDNYRAAKRSGDCK